jgi:hypothetical protein
MSKLLIGAVLTVMIAGCAPAMKKLTPMPTHKVHTDAEWESGEDEEEMDPLIPGYNPLLSKDPTEQLLMRFRGVDRKSPKTSIASGSVKTYASIEALIDALPDDADMLDHTPPLETSTNTRFAEEQGNVRVTAWIYAIKYEADQDWHVILGTDPADTTPTYFNAEVSGLPANNAASYQKLKKVRQALAEMFDFDLPATGYWEYEPVPVIVEGSLFYDIDHKPGSVGPAATRPKTAWEIHPITKLKEQ